MSILKKLGSLFSLGGKTANLVSLGFQPIDVVHEETDDSIKSEVSYPVAQQEAKSKPTPRTSPDLDALRQQYTGKI